MGRILILIAVMLVAVQGYAQERRGVNNHRIERVSRQDSRSNSGHSVQERTPQRQNSQGTRSVQERTSQRQNSQGTRSVQERTSQRQNSQGTRSIQERTSGRSSVSAPSRVETHPNSGIHQRYPLGIHRPVYHHHQNNYHHHHVCIFDNWYWYTWGGYHNRFIRHALYHNRFFDNLLGYYLWGTFEYPTRLDLGNLSITRYNNRLKIFTGYDTTYLDLYRNQRVVYKVGYTSVEITTNYGYASVYFYDEYGNTATYNL